MGEMFPQWVNWPIRDLKKKCLPVVGTLVPATRRLALWWFPPAKLLYVVFGHRGDPPGSRMTDPEGGWATKFNQIMDYDNDIKPLFLT